MSEELYKRIAQALKQKPPHRTDREWVNFTCPYCGAKERFGVNLTQGRCYCFRCLESPFLVSFLRSLGLTGLGVLRTRKDPSERFRRKSKKPTYREVSLKNYRRLSPSKEWTEDPGYVVKTITHYVESRHVDLSLWEVGISDDEELFGRAIFIFRQDGVPVYYQAREVIGNSGIKTVNPGHDEAWPKSEVLFGFDLLQEGMSVAIGEGPFDAVALTDLENSILGTCILGKTSLSDALVGLLNEKKVPCVYLALDSDAESDSSQMALQLLDKGQFQVRVVQWQNIEVAGDPSELGPTWCRLLLAQAVSFTKSNRWQMLHSGSASKSARRSLSKRKIWRASKGLSDRRHR